MLDIAIGAAALAAMCTLWVLWQRLAEHIDPGCDSDRRAGGRCCVPHEPRPAPRSGESP